MSKLKEMEAKVKDQSMVIIEKEDALFNCMVLADGIKSLLESGKADEAQLNALAAGIRAIANESLSF
jgi:hypothetical protein